MALTSEEFARLDDADKLPVLYSELMHLRTNVRAAADLEAQVLRDQENRLRTAELNLAVLRGQLRTLSLLGIAVFGVALAALVQSLGL